MTHESAMSQDTHYDTLIESYTVGTYAHSNNALVAYHLWPCVRVFSGRHLQLQRLHALAHLLARVSFLKLSLNLHGFGYCMLALHVIYTSALSEHLGSAAASHAGIIFCYES